MGEKKQVKTSDEFRNTDCKWIKLIYGFDVCSFYWLIHAVVYIIVKPWMQMLGCASLLNCDEPWFSGQQRGRPSAGPADRRGSVVQGEDQLSSDEDTHQQDSTNPDTWAEIADERNKAQQQLGLLTLKSNFKWHFFFFLQ